VPPWCVFLRDLRSLRVLAMAAIIAVGAAVCAHTAPAGFDGGRAYVDVRQLVAFGPRPAGSPALQAARGYIATQLKATGWTAEELPFEAQTPLGPRRMVNVRATQSGNAYGPRLIIGGHYDTKLFREFPFVGANDGGSSAAFLLELARALKGRDNRLPIELLFLDGEESLIDWTDDDHTYGSRHYVAEARRTGDLANIRAFILVDMIGDRDLGIRREQFSTPWLTDAIWTAAKRLKRQQFLDETTPIEDDHQEFLAAGVPAVDIIDLDYAAWHRPEDRLDRVAAGSLQVVGDVLLDALPDIERRVK
jgi:glutaminyl-peptide cyclotransferase